MSEVHKLNLKKKLQKIEDLIFQKNENLNMSSINPINHCITLK
jgi:hypothetical protein